MAEPEYPAPEESRAVADSSPAAILVENTEHQEVSEGGSALQTIDLHSRSQTRPASDETPVLQFDSGSGEMEDMKTDSQTSLDEVSPVEGTELHRVRTSSRGATFKEWSTHHYKVTKYAVSEKFGKSTRTVDPQLEARIEALKETQRKYSQLISLTNQFCVQFTQTNETQKSLAEQFAFLSIRSPELHIEFQYNSEAQKRIARNGDTLLSAARRFASNLQTVSAKTMEDTLQTVKNYESVRLTYDAYRTELEALRKTASVNQANAAKLPAATADFEKHKQKYEQLRHDVDIKLKLLDENKLKVTRKQLYLLHKAFAAYFSNNHELMETMLQEFRSKLEETQSRERDPPAWLEELPSANEED